MRKQYRDIPRASHGALGQGVLELFRAEDRAAEEDRRAAADALEKGLAPAKRKEKPPPRLTWKSFHRVCAALGLHLNEKRGQAAIRKFSSEPIAGRSPPGASAAASSGDGSDSSPLSSAIEPGMSFDDFMCFYAGLSKPLSLAQEMREVWRLLDDDLDGRVALSTLRTTMIGLELIQPSNTKSNSTYFYETNFKYHFTDAEKAMTTDQLVDALMKAHFQGKNFDTDTITFQEFVEYLYA